jgi:hypothetical protein
MFSYLTIFRIKFFDIKNYLILSYKKKNLGKIKFSKKLFDSKKAKS